LGFVLFLWSRFPGLAELFAGLFHGFPCGVDSLAIRFCCGLFICGFWISGAMVLALFDGG
jgi:hypothetical protein